MTPTTTALGYIVAGVLMGVGATLFVVAVLRRPVESARVFPKPTEIRTIQLQRDAAYDVLLAAAEALRCKFPSGATLLIPRQEGDHLWIFLPKDSQLECKRLGRAENRKP